MTLEEIKRAAVVGAGTMGAGIGLCLALAGLEVRLYDVARRSLELARERIDDILELFVAEGLVSPEQSLAARRRVRLLDDLPAATEGVQFALEAVPEDLELKRRVWAGLERLVADEAILASNTSGLSISALAAVCRLPARVAGMHWFNPPELIPLVEIVNGEKTAAATSDLLYDLALKLGKRPIRVGREVPGFVANRLQYALLREALRLVEDGVADPREVDEAVKAGLGFRWSWLGPLETVDLGGVDVFHAVSEYLFPTLAGDPGPTPRFTALLRSGRLGVKAGAGFYSYDPGAKRELITRRDTFFARQGRLIKELAAVPGRETDAGKAGTGA